MCQLYLGATLLKGVRMVKKYIQSAILVLSLGLNVLLVIPGNQGEAVIQKAIEYLTKLVS